MIYKTNCGLKTKDYDNDKGKTKQIYLQKKLIKGESPESYEDWNMNEECIGCGQVKTKTEKYLNVDNGATYECEIKYCVAHKVTAKQELKNKEAKK